MNVHAVTSEAIRAKLYQPVTSASKRNSKAESAKGSATAEKVEISGKADEVSMVKSHLDQLPDVRLEVVEDIRSRIEMNDYPLENNLDQAVKMMLEKSVLTSF
jgi:anti-sigma28 factor (negative regulator of flagellin synthesis)